MRQDEKDYKIFSIISEIQSRLDLTDKEIEEIQTILDEEL
jgi:hypothetical protein